MPIKYEGKKYGFNGLEKKIEREKGLPKDKAAAYTATVERAEKKANLDTRIASLLIASGGYDITCPSCGEHALGKSGSAPSSCPSCGTKMGKARIAGVGHDNATRGATDAEQKIIDKARKSKRLYGGELNKSLTSKSHPFNKMASLYKLQILSRVKGASYVPRDSDPQYENLDVESRQGIDHLFNEQKVAIIATKLASMAFSGSASAPPKKEGADVEKEKEKIPKGISDPFDFLGAKIREAVMSDFTYKETKVKQTGWGGKINNPGPVSVSEPKKDPEEFGGGLSGKQKQADLGYNPSDSSFNGIDSSGKLQKIKSNPIFKKKTPDYTDAKSKGITL